MMDLDKQCKGCGKQVMKPMTCEDCGMAVHPGCISRVNHPSLGGRFAACIPATSSPLSTDALSQIRELIRAEFAIMKEEWRRLYRADIERVNAEIQKVSSRIDELENRLCASNSEPASNPVVLENVVEEIQERERRAQNLIFFDVEESVVSGLGDETVADESKVNEAVRVIAPEIKIVKTMRIGRSRTGHVRPLKVILADKDDAITILKNKYKYRGHAKIKQDLSKQQRDYLRNLRARLGSMHDSGITNKTIRYINGTPKIVDMQKKNVE